MHSCEPTYFTSGRVFKNGLLLTSGNAGEEVVERSCGRDGRDGRGADVDENLKTSATPTAPTTTNSPQRNRALLFTVLLQSGSVPVCGARFGPIPPAGNNQKKSTKQSGTEAIQFPGRSFSSPGSLVSSKSMTLRPADTVRRSTVSRLYFSGTCSISSGGLNLLITIE